MVVVVCEICGSEIIRVDWLGSQHARQLRKHLAIHRLGAETFSPTDVLKCFRVRREPDANEPPD